jgi:glycosyltransferase involved in cell wall biosynthesis
MISLVIPAYDEQEAISTVVVRADRALAGIEHEVIVVDDGSRDKTSETARAAGATVIRHPHNLGYGAAVKSGVRSARFDTIAIADADGTYPLDQIVPLLNEYAKGFDMVVGARRGTEYRESVLKSPLRLLLKWLVEFTAGRDIPDINSGLRVFSRNTSMTYFSHLCDTFSFTTSLTLAYMMTGKFLSYLPISYGKRIGRTKVRLFRDSLRTLQFIVQAIVYYNPLKIFILMSGLVFLIAVACIAVAAWSQWVGLYYTGTIGIMISMLVFSIGLLAELLRQIMSKH